MINLKASESNAIRLLKTHNQGPYILKHVLLEENYTLSPYMSKLMRKVDGYVESELRTNFKSWFIVSDNLQFSYDIRNWGQLLNMEYSKIEDAIEIANSLKRGHMEGKQ